MEHVNERKVVDWAQTLSRYAAENPRGLPPVHLWNPPFCGDMDMRIARDGQWFYQGSPIGRMAMVRLFSRVLRRDDDGFYYLVTPVEKLRIIVDDAPFVANLVDREHIDGRWVLKFTTTVGDEILAGPEHELWVHSDAKTQEPSPYMHVRARLHARIGRNAYYQLANWAEERDVQGKQVFGVESLGCYFVIS